MTPVNIKVWTEQKIQYTKKRKTKKKKNETRSKMQRDAS
jgi:hypothetical protein